jgi:hypothetical protein
MNGVIWWKGKIIPLEKFAEALNAENRDKKQWEEKNPPPK